MDKRAPKKFTRRTGVRHYRKMFLIFTEGKTEASYFKQLLTNKDVVLKIFHKDSASAPQNLFKYALEYLNKNEAILRPYDHEIWVVIDREDGDKRSVQEIEEVYSQCAKQGYNLAISNPTFEYWLLLHYEDGKKITSSKKCIAKLKKYLPDYDKSETPKYLQDKINDAISRAKEKNNPTEKWPTQCGTTVYLLVEKLI